MAQRTPGPWGFGRVSGEIYQADDRRSYPTIAAVDLTRPQAIADGGLIAAAPDLLDVARMLVDGMDPNTRRFDIGDCVMRAHAAIAKAEGRS